MDDALGASLAAQIRRLTDAAPVARAHACKQLARLAARGDQSRAAIREAGGVQGVLPLLHAAPTQAEAAGALAALAVDAEVRLLIREAGGCTPLVRALQSKSAAAQEEAARALGCLARDEDGRIEVAELGGIVALVELVQLGDRDMQLAAAGALNQLALNADNRIAIVAADGHDVLIELLRGGETPAPAPLQAEAAGTLASLAFYAPNKRKVREGGGLERLVGALSSKSPEVAIASAAALARYTKYDAECQASASAAGAVRALAALLWSEDEATRQHARAALENLNAHPETEKAAWAQAKAEMQTGQVAEAEKLRSDADERLLVGELDAASQQYTEALVLHPRSAVLQRRLARTERERVSASSSIERLAARATSVRLTRRKLASKAPDPLKLQGMPDGVLTLIEQFRAVDARRQHHGQAAHTAPSFTSAREQLDEASAQLDATQSALFRYAVETAPPQVLPPTTSQASRRGSTAGGHFAFAVGKENKLLPPDVAQMIEQRDGARQAFVQAAETFLSRLHAEAFQESHEAAVHVIGPLQQAADQLGQVPVLGAQALGEEAEAVPDQGQDVDPEAPALTAFDLWIDENTAATVGTKTEEALSALLSGVTSLLVPRSAAAQTASEQALYAVGTTREEEEDTRQALLASAVREADGRLATEQRYWQLADPIRFLPVGVIRRSAGGLLRDLAMHIDEVEALYTYGELVEERRDSTLQWIEADEPPTVKELVEFSDLARGYAEELEEVTLSITRLRNELEATRDNRRLQEMETKAKTLRRRRYEAEKSLKSERKRLCLLAAEHFPEMPLRFPDAGIRLEDTFLKLKDHPELLEPLPPKSSSFAEKDLGGPMRRSRAVTVTAGEQSQSMQLQSEMIAEGGSILAAPGGSVMGGLDESVAMGGVDPTDPTGAAQGLGGMLEAQAAGLAMMRDKLALAEQQLEQNRRAEAEAAAGHESAAGDGSHPGTLEWGGVALSGPGLVEEEERALERQRRELRRRQRAFALKCQLAGRSVELVAAPHSVAAAAIDPGMTELADFLGGRTELPVSPRDRQQEPEEDDYEALGLEPQQMVVVGESGALRGSASVTMAASAVGNSSPSWGSRRPRRTASPPQTMSRPRSSNPAAKLPASVARRSAGVTMSVASLLPEAAAPGDAGEDGQAVGGGGVRNAMMSAAAQRASAEESRQQVVQSPPPPSPAMASIIADHVVTADPHRKLTRLEKARQQASARIMLGAEPPSDNDSRNRSPSPPRTISARVAAGAPAASMPTAFRQPRTASELDFRPPPPPLEQLSTRLEAAVEEEQPDYDQEEDEDARVKSVTSRVRDSLGVNQLPGYGAAYPSTSHQLAAMDTDRNGKVSRGEFAQHPRSVQSTMAYAEYVGGMSANMHTTSAASNVGWSAPPPASPMPAMPMVTESPSFGGLTSSRPTSSRMDLLAAARARLDAAATADL